MTTCLELFAVHDLSGLTLQNEVEDKFPDGACENCSISPYSPGPVEETETLQRIVFHPIHMDEQGNVASIAFDDVWNSDLSVFRFEKVTDEELQLVAEQMKANGLAKTVPQVRRVFEHRLVLTSAIRNKFVDDTTERAFRVYDTAEVMKPNHASIFLSKLARTKMSRKSVRKRLFELFQPVANQSFSKK